MIGYLALKKDPRYARKRTYARFLTQALGSPYPAAKVAIAESRFAGMAAGAEFKLERRRAKGGAKLAAAALEMADAGVRYLLVDAPAPLVDEVARATRGRDLLLFNVSARDDALRQAQCQPHLLHVIPEPRDAHRCAGPVPGVEEVARGAGADRPRPEDERLTAAFERSAKRFGVEIVERRPFVLSNDPRERRRTTWRCSPRAPSMTWCSWPTPTGSSPATSLPDRPSAAGGRDGRARRRGLALGPGSATGRRSSKTLREAGQTPDAQRGLGGLDGGEGGGRGGAAHRRHGVSEGARLPARDEIVLDGIKGNRLSFRPWNRQLRQPLLLVTHNWVVDRAPLRGFLHRSNNLDTLGFDERDSRCASGNRCRGRFGLPP